VAQEVFHTCLVDVSKELDTAKELLFTELALPPHAGVGLVRRSHFIS